MRTPTLQYLYLQRPLMFLLLITIISVCWIYAGDFYTKEELREASVAASMVEKNDWILSNPPLTHWLMAIFSLPRGEVSVLSARLPSAIAFVLLIGTCFLFFGHRIKSMEAFLTCLLLITSFELHRSAMTAGANMVFTALIVLGLFCLFRWEENKNLKNFPIGAVIVLSCATLTKGPVGIILPLFVLGVYLLILKYNFWKIAWKFILIALASMILPAIWHFLVHRQGVQLVWIENSGCFFSGEQPLGYSFIALVSGFLPWTLLLFMSLFAIKYSLKFSGFRKIWDKVLSMNKVKLFSLITAVVIVFFYAVAASKSNYLMPAYPFIAVFMAQYILYLVEYKSKITRFFSIIIGSIGTLVALIVFLTVITQLVEPVQLFGFIKNERILSDIAVVWDSLTAPNLLYIILFGVLLGFVYTLFNLQRKKSNLKILYATTGICLAIYLVLDGIFIPAFVI